MALVMSIKTEQCLWQVKYHVVGEFVLRRARHVFIAQLKLNGFQPKFLYRRWKSLHKELKRVKGVGKVEGVLLVDDWPSFRADDFVDS